MAAPKERGEEVRVLRSELTFPSETGEPRKVVYVTYTVKDLPPGVITIPKGEWTEKREAELIKADVEARRKVKPVTVRV